MNSNRFLSVVAALALLGCSPKDPAKMLEADLKSIGIKLKWNPLIGIGNAKLISREISDVHVSLLLEGDLSEVLVNNIKSHCGDPMAITRRTNGVVNFVMYSESCFGAVFSCGSRMVNEKMLTTVNFNKKE